MKKHLNIHTKGLTDVRNQLRRPRVRLALASSGVAGTLLLAGLFGFQGHSSASQEARTTTPAVRSAAAKTDVQMNVLAYKTSSSTQSIEVAHQASNASYQNIARQAAKSYGLDPQFFINQIQQESGFNPGAVSPAGAVGIAQFMPATAANVGVNPWEPVQALYGAARLMADLKAQFGGNYAMALAGYNAGPGAVQSAINAGGNNWYSYLPTETQNYIAVILHW